jgi:toxin ParE1/3/4
VKLRIRPAGRADLAEQVAFLVERDGCKLGDRFIRAVRKTLDLLVAAPRLGRIRRFRNPLLQGIRSWPVEGFSQQLVFYRASATEIEVVRVIHGARDIPTLLED